MTIDELSRRIRSARVLLDELENADLHGVDSAELHILAANLEFQVSLLEAEVKAQRAV